MRGKHSKQAIYIKNGKRFKKNIPAWKGKHYRKTELDIIIEKIIMFCSNKNNVPLLCEHNPSSNSSFDISSLIPKINIKEKPKVLVAGMSTALIVSSALATISYLQKKNVLKNQFVLGTVNPEITENFNTNTKTKSNVSVKNMGNVPVYVRVIIVMNWKNSEGTIIGEMPLLDSDYTITLSNSSNWMKGNDGYYYYKLAVKPGESTDVLIETLQQIVINESQNFVVDIVAQTVQAEPDEAVKESWNVDITNGNIVLKDEE